MTVYTGSTVEEAIERGLKRERLARENAHIEIEQKESGGFLGVGRKRARVNIEPINEDTARRANRLAARGVDESDLEVPKAESAMEATLRLSQVVKAVREAGIHEDENLTDEEKEEEIEKIKEKVSEDPKGEEPKEGIPKKEEPEKETSKDETRDETLDAVIPAAKSPEAIEQLEATVPAYLTAIVQGMGIETKVTVEKTEKTLVFNLSSDSDALLIGKHGKILTALETLVKAYAHVQVKSYVSVAVNVGDYHKKREDYLTRLAERAAERALEGETVYVNDLPANERKIVHHAIGEIKGVNSHSEGHNAKRYIVVRKDE